MPRKPAKATSDTIEVLNRQMEDAIGVHLFDGVRAMRNDLSEGDGQKALHDAIESNDFNKLNRRIPYDSFNKHVDRVADKIGALAPQTRKEVRTGIKGGFTGGGVQDDLLRRPFNFDAPLPGKTPALTEGRNAMHANVKRIVTQDRYVSGETRQRMRDYMKDLLGPQKRSITSAIQEGVAGKLSVPQIAAKIRNEIGLTERQRIAVKNSYNSAISRGLSEDDAIAESKTTSERLLQYRADTIAITETRTLSETIKTSEWLSLEGDGKLGENPTVTWILGALDDKTCPMCIAVSNTSMPLGTSFVLTDGTECLPGFAHPRCRCYSMLTTDDDSEGGGKDDVDARTPDAPETGPDAEAAEYDAMASRA